jgi:8-oxo-dGTP diphosphatase
MSSEKLSSETLRKHKGLSFTGITTVFFCHDGKGKIFLTKRSKRTRDEQGRWDPGAGGLKHGQTLEENLLRELKEEYDVTPFATEFIGYLDVFRKNDAGQSTHWLAMYFAVRVDPHKVHVNEPDKVDDSGWFSLDALPTPLHSQFEPFIAKHGDKFRQIMTP